MPSNVLLWKRLLLNHDLLLRHLIYLTLWLALSSAVCGTSIGALLNERKNDNRKTAIYRQKADELKGLSRFSSSLPFQTNFPYRFIFPANHPYASYAHFLNTETHPSSYPVQKYSYDAYSASSPSAMQQQQQQKLELLLSQQHLSPISSYQSAPGAMPPVLQQQHQASAYQSTATPMMVLLQPNQVPSPVQTFILMPADATHSPLSSNIASYSGSAAAQSPQFSVAAPATSNVPLPQRAALIPLNYHPQQFLSPNSQYYKTAQNIVGGQTQLLQRPGGAAGVYHYPAKYIALKKNSYEPKIRNFKNHKNRMKFVDRDLLPAESVESKSMASPSNFSDPFKPSERIL